MCRGARSRHFATGPLSQGSGTERRRQAALRRPHEPTSGPPLREDPSVLDVERGRPGLQRAESQARRARRRASPTKAAMWRHCSTVEATWMMIQPVIVYRRKDSDDAPRAIPQKRLERETSIHDQQPGLRWLHGTIASKVQRPKSVGRTEWHRGKVGVDNVIHGRVRIAVQDSLADAWIGPCSARRARVCRRWLAARPGGLDDARAARSARLGAAVHHRAGDRGLLRRGRSGVGLRRGQRPARGRRAAGARGRCRSSERVTVGRLPGAASDPSVAVLAFADMVQAATRAISARALPRRSSMRSPGCADRGSHPAPDPFSSRTAP